MPSMEQSSFGSKRQDKPDFNLKECGLKARISLENTNSQRFSASNLRSFREDERSFKSNITISSTVSSPGYTIKEEIDPSKYSFTTALKALQAKTVYTLEYLSSDGLTLNSKWNDAEKYICNPLSGEVPLECLSAKTLSGRSFRSLKSRITMSAPLIYPSLLQQFQAKSPIIENENELKITIQEKKKSTTRDVGTQSTLADLSSSSPTPVPTPSIEERSRKHSETEAGDSPVSSGKQKSEAEVEVRETREREYRKTKEGRDRKKVTRKQMMMCRCNSQGGGGGCLSLKGLWQRDKCKPRNNYNPPSSPTFLYHINACYNE